MNNEGIQGLSIHIGEFELFIHQTIFIWLGIGVVVCALACWGGSKIRKADPTQAPKGAVLVFEVIGDAILGIIGTNLKNKKWKYVPILGTLMVMMAFSNLMGLLGLQMPTSNLSIVLSLVVAMLVLIHGTNIKLHGFKGKLKEWCSPYPALLPLNIIGDIAFPISLTFRLFGNMLGGTVLMMLIYMVLSGLLPWGAALFAVTPFLHFYFDIFAGLMQTYIFFTLASFFLAEGADVEEE